jgi:hypothetical protein
MLARNIAIIQVNESNNLKCFRKGNVSANVSANKYWVGIVVAVFWNSKLLLWAGDPSALTHSYCSRHYCLKTQDY